MDSNYFGDDELYMGYTNEFIEKIKTTEEYKSFICQVELMSNFPKLKEQLDDYRHENFILQNTLEEDDLFDKQDELEMKYEKILCDSRVRSFLRAEAAFCKMMQNIFEHITEGLHFQ